MVKLVYEPFEWPAHFIVRYMCFVLISLAAYDDVIIVITPVLLFCRSDVCFSNTPSVTIHSDRRYSVVCAEKTQ